jgi:hypothetical protein
MSSKEKQMARARNIKPKFFTNDVLGELTPLTRLFFIGLWTIADYRGCLEYRPKKIKALVLPFDDCNIDELVINLEQSRFIAIYSVQGKRYLKIAKFEQHQNPHPNEKKAGTECPDISENDSEINGLDEDGKNREQDGTNRAVSLFPLTDSLLLNPSSGIPQPATVSRDEKLANDFEEVWAVYPRRPGMSKSDSFKKWKALIKAGNGPETILAGVVRYANYVQYKQTEPEFIKQPATFFGPGKHFESDWSTPSNGHAHLGKAGRATANAAREWLGEDDSAT